jgi:hypothetical protein
MTKETRFDVQVYSALAMLAAGVILSVAGFCVPPVGEISDSVLWFFAQCLIYSGSALGVTVYIHNKFSEIETRLRSKGSAASASSEVNGEKESEVANG